MPELNISWITDAHGAYGFRPGVAGELQLPDGSFIRSGRRFKARSQSPRDNPWVNAMLVQRDILRRLKRAG